MLYKHYHHSCTYAVYGSIYSCMFTIPRYSVTLYHTNCKDKPGVGTTFEYHVHALTLCKMAKVCLLVLCILVSVLSESVQHTRS